MNLFKRNKKKKKNNPYTAIKYKNLRKTKGKSNIRQNRNPYSSSFFSPKKLKQKKQSRKLSTVLLPPGKMRKTNESKIKKIIALVLLVFLCAITIHFIFFTDYFKIRDFRIIEDQTEVINNLKLNQSLAKELNNINILLLDQNKLKKKILEQNPEFKTAKITKKLPNMIVLNLRKFSQSANIIVLVTSQNDNFRTQKKYIVNSNGMIIIENEENPELPYIEIDSGKALEIGEIAITKERLDYILKTINYFEEKIGLRVINAKFLKRAREVHLFVENDFHVWLDMNYLNMENNMIPQVEKLRKALSKLDIKNGSIQYIDLRIAGTEAEKVIYKTK